MHPPRLPCATSAPLLPVPCTPSDRSPVHAARARPADRGEFGYAQDTSLAIRWLSDSAAAGNPLARLHVGSMLASGEVPDADLPWLCERHWTDDDKGDDEAVPTGAGSRCTAEDLATRLYARAARQGHPSAEYALGSALVHGRGVARDVPAGRRWLEKAASQGETEVMAAGWAADELRALDAAHDPGR